MQISALCLHPSFNFFFLLRRAPLSFILFFFNDTATTEIYTLSLHDALPILRSIFGYDLGEVLERGVGSLDGALVPLIPRSEEHRSELQSQSNLVCRLLLEKKKKKTMLYMST